MSKPKNGGPAFPRAGFLSPVESDLALAYDSHPQDGMALRDYFSAAALQGILAGSVSIHGKPFSPDYDHHMQMLANASYKMADAMLAARNQKAAP